MSLVAWETLILKRWDDPDIVMPECWKKISKKWRWFQWLPWAVIAVPQLPSHSPHTSLGLSWPSQAQCPNTAHSVSQNLVQSRKQRIRQLDGFQKVMESNIITVPMKKLRLKELAWLLQVPQPVVVRSRVNTLQTFARLGKEPMMMVAISLKLCWPQWTGSSARQRAVPKMSSQLLLDTRSYGHVTWPSSPTPSFSFSSFWSSTCCQSYFSKVQIILSYRFLAQHAPVVISHPPESACSCPLLQLPFHHFSRLTT